MSRDRGRTQTLSERGERGTDERGKRSAGGRSVERDAGVAWGSPGRLVDSDLLAHRPSICCMQEAGWAPLTNPSQYFLLTEGALSVVYVTAPWQVLDACD